MTTGRIRSGLLAAFAARSGLSPAAQPTSHPNRPSMEIRDAAWFLAYFESVRARTVRVVRCIPPDQLEWARRTTTPAGNSITVWKWLRAMPEHEIHHRGQIYLMLGLAGVATPPIFGLTSEEVRERSVAP